MPIREFVDDMSLCCGWDSINGRVRGVAITRAPMLSPLNENPGQQAFAVMQQVESFSSFQESMGIDVAMKLRGLFAKGDAKFSFAKSSNFSTFSVNLLVSTKIKNHPKQMNIDEVRLLEPAFKLWRDKPDQFVKRFGTEFISGEISGGELFGLVQIHTSSASEKSALSSQIGFRSIVFSGNAALKTELENQTKGKNVDITCFRSGGVVENPTTVEEMVALFRTMPQLADERPWVYNVITRGYEELLEVPEPLPTAILRKRQDTLKRLTSYYFRYEELMKNLEFIVANPGQFPDYKADAGKATKNEIEAQQELILKNIMNCSDSEPEDIPTACKIGDEILAPSIQLPQRVGGNTHSKQLYSVSARDPQWQSTGLDIVSGQAVTIRVVDGDWTIGDGLRSPGRGQRYDGPDKLLLPTAWSGALIARITSSKADDPGELFEVGESRYNYIPITSGELQLACNDGQHPDGAGYHDNNGTIRVSVSLGYTIPEAELSATTLVFDDKKLIVAIEGKDSHQVIDNGLS